jgi:hypothetical protein
MERALEGRLSVIGRAALEAAGLTDGMIKRAYRRLDEGLDATRVKVFREGGEVVVGPEQVDYTERREAAKEVLRVADHYPNRLEHEVSGEIVYVFKGLREDGV